MRYWLVVLGLFDFLGWSLWVTTKLAAEEMEREEGSEE